MLFKLSQNKGFILYSRISWEQNMKRGELISALTLAKAVGMLHSHIGPGRSSGKWLSLPAVSRRSWRIRAR